MVAESAKIGAFGHVSPIPAAVAGPRSALKTLDIYAREGIVGNVSDGAAVPAMAAAPRREPAVGRPGASGWSVGSSWLRTSAPSGRSNRSSGRGALASPCPGGGP